MNAAGEKLSKQTRAMAVNPEAGTQLLAFVLRFLGHSVPEAMTKASLRDFWAWAVAAWSMERVPSVRAIFPGDSLVP